MSAAVVQEVVFCFSLPSTGQLSHSFYIASFIPLGVQRYRRPNKLFPLIASTNNHDKVTWQGSGKVAETSSVTGIQLCQLFSLPCYWKTQGWTTAAVVKVLNLMDDSNKNCSNCISNQSYPRRAENDNITYSVKRAFFTATYARLI